MELTKGYMSTMVASIFVLILAAGLVVIAQNPSILNVIMGAPLYAKYGAIIIAVLIGLTDFAYPRIKESVESGIGLQFNLGSIMSWIMTFIVIILTTIVTEPDLLKPILNDNYALYTAVMIPVLIVILKILKPRTIEEAV